LGAVAARLAIPENIDRAHRFNELASLPAGSMVTCYWNKRRRGVVSGIEDESGFLIIEFERGDRIRLGPRSDKIDAIFAQGGMDEAAARPVTPTPLLMDVVGHEFPPQGVNRSRFDCVIVGTRSELEAEIGEAEFLAPQDGALRSGRLQEVLRVRSLLHQDEAYRTDIIPAASQGTPSEIRLRMPRIVVFDGAKAFLRFQKQFTKTHCVAVLDRTESSFSDAINQIRAEWARRRGDEPLANGEAVPDGIEVLEFWRN
jgi:hypothetical protein